MLLDIFTNALSFALCKSFTFYRGEFANEIVFLYFIIAKYFITSKGLIVAHKLHRQQLFFNFLFYVYKSGFRAHHRALTSFFSESIQTDLMESVLALFAFPRIYKYRLAKCAKQFWLYLLVAHNVFGVHAKGHALEIGN